MFVNEESNDLAEKSIDVALDYVKRNNKLGLNINLLRTAGNRTDSKGILDSCKETKLHSEILMLSRIAVEAKTR